MSCSTDWRICNCIPIFRNGDHSLISLISVVCKVMESIVKDAVLVHLLDNCLLNLYQHGFLPSRSCISNFWEFLCKLTIHVDASRNIDVDFKKTHDKYKGN